MIKYNKKIVQFGFGAVGKSFFEKISNEISFDKYKYYVISRNKLEYKYFIELGGMAANFITENITKENFKEIFEKYLDEGDFLIDFADSVGTKDILEWAANRNIMYLNTGEADWPEHWYNIFEENLKKNSLIEEFNNNNKINKYPIVLQHGNNPGLVSHFVKAGLEYIVKKQLKLNKRLNKLLKQKKFNLIAKELELEQIHVNDIDYQKIVDSFDENKLYSTWCIDSFFFEIISEATSNIGSYEKINYQNLCKNIDYENGFLEFKNLAFDTICNTYYPNGKFEGYMVPHEETITIAKNLEVKENDKIIYRPTVSFIYSPCELAKKYLENSRVNDYLNPDITKALNQENNDGIVIIRGFKYPKLAEIPYKEKIQSGTEYVGVLLLGKKFKPVWVGNRIEQKFLYKSEKNSYWQTPTITPVAMSALSAACYMIKNQKKGGVFFPDNIQDYKSIIKLAEKYISKTIYKTFSKSEVENKLNIKLDNLQLKDIIKNFED